MSPVEMAFDENGKVYVAEMMDYPEDPPAGKAGPIAHPPARGHRTATARSTAVTIFAENVLAVSGFMPWKGGLIVTSAPDILFLKDTNGDGKADVRTGALHRLPESRTRRLASPIRGSASITGSIARTPAPTAASLRRGHPEMPPVLVRGADFRFDPISGKAEAASGPAQFGSTHRRLRPSLHHAEHDAYPARRRADEISRARSAAGGSRGGAGHLRSRPSLGADVPADRTAGMAQAAHRAAPAALQREQGQRHRAAERLVHGRVRRHDLQRRRVSRRSMSGTSSPATSAATCASRHPPARTAPTFAAHRAKEKVEFLASTDVWFRPCNFANAPDGNLYVTDIYRQVIETPESIPEEIRKKINFFNGDTLGRIYRIVPNHPLRQGNLKPNLGAAELGRAGQAARQSERLASADGASAAAGAAGSLRRFRRCKNMAGERHRRPKLACTLCGCCMRYRAAGCRGVHDRVKDADPRIRENALQLERAFSRANRRRSRNAVIALRRRSRSARAVSGRADAGRM